GQIRNHEEVERRVGLAVGDDLAGSDVALDDHPAARRRYEEARGHVGAARDGLELLCGNAQRAQARRGALALGDSLAPVVLRVADLLLRDRLRLEELAREGQGFLAALDVGNGLDVIAFGLTEVGAVEEEEALAGLDDLAGAGQDFDDAPGRGRLDANELLLVELRLAARLDGRGA